MQINELLNRINIKQNIKQIPDLQIGDGKLKPHFEFSLKPTKLKEWWENFKFNVTINW
jgi:hypothetical protein